MYAKRVIALALALALALPLAACGGDASQATAMHLVKTEGTVGVSDAEGKDVVLLDNLGLYSGYGVSTQAESYGWINLDDAKLTKLDEDSEVEVIQEGKHLELVVKSGGLFFNITEPLGEDEAMNIRTSTMIVGIRGTCGWVTQDAAALLEGTVEVTAGGQNVTVTAGEMAVLTGDGELTVVPFHAYEIAAFVLDEIDGQTMERLGDILAPGISPEARAVLAGTAYYGDPEACTMTAEQALALAQALQAHIAEYPNRVAVLFDTGAGSPAVIFGTLDPALQSPVSATYYYQEGSAVCTWTGVLEYSDGAVSLLCPQMEIRLYTDYVVAWYPVDEDAEMAFSNIYYARGEDGLCPATPEEWGWLSGGEWFIDVYGGYVDAPEPGPMPAAEEIADALYAYAGASVLHTSPPGGY